MRYVKDVPAPVFTSKLVPTETRPSFFPCAKAEEFFVGIPYGEFIAAGKCCIILYKRSVFITSERLLFIKQAFSF